MSMYRVRVWEMRFRWAWLDWLLTEPISDHLHRNMERSFECARRSISDLPFVRVKIDQIRTSDQGTEETG